MNSNGISVARSALVKPTKADDCFIRGFNTKCSENEAIVIPSLHFVGCFLMNLRETGLTVVLGHFYCGTNYIEGSFLHDRVLMQLVATTLLTADSCLCPAE